MNLLKLSSVPCVYVCMCVYVYVFAFTYASILYIYIYKHIYMDPPSSNCLSVLINPIALKASSGFSNCKRTCVAMLSLQCTRAWSLNSRSDPRNQYSALWYIFGLANRERNGFWAYQSSPSSPLPSTHSHMPSTPVDHCSSPTSPCACRWKACFA